MMLKTALMVSNEPGGSTGFLELSKLLQRFETQLEQVSEANAIDRVKSYVGQNHETDIVIFCPSLERPISLARRVRAVDPFAQLVFLLNSQNEEDLKRQLSLAPMIGTNWSLARVADDDLAELVAEAIRSAQQSRRHRTTLDRVNLHISPTSFGAGGDYRKLVLSDRYLHSVLDQAQDAILGADDRGMLTSLNRAATLLFGCTEADVLGTSVLQLCGGEWEVRLARIVEDLRCGVAPTLEEVECRRPDGLLFLVEVSAGLVTDGLNRPLGISIVARDITARKQVEEEARETSQRLQAIFRQASVGIAQVSLEGRFIEVNERYCEIVGRPAAELIQLNVLDITAAEAHATSRAFIQHLRDLGTPFSIEKQVVRPDGSHVWVHSDVSAVTDGDGQVVSAVDVTVDVSEKLQAAADQLEIAEQREQLLESERAARAAAERASQMKDEFLATLSHELRTPLNAILGWSQLLKLATPGGEEFAQGLEVIERNARAQAQIIEDLLDMSRIISGKVRLDVQRLDLASVVQAAIETSRPAAEAKGIRLISVIDPLVGSSIRGDANRLQQVLWNLLSNAVKFTPKGGKIQVLLERVNSHVEISVIDNGEGIRQEFMPHVFDRFRQEDASTTRRHGGLGLGLSIVKQLVELHGGSVRVKSGGPGKGTTFIIALPLTVVHLDPVEEQERRHPRVNAGDSTGAEPCAKIAGLRVLVVDDEPDARALVKRLLEDCHATAMTAASASQALELVRTNRFDVIVSDIGMPDEDGYSLIRRIRALHADEGGDVPAIALTAYARTEDRIKAVSAGFLMHVAKPVEPLELITMVAAATGRT